MTTYATLNPDGSIKESASWPFPGSTPVDKDITHGRNGILYYADDPALVLTLEQAKKAKIATIDAETSAVITAGFTHMIEGTVYHFSYDTFDQQNFADTATVASAALAGQNAPDMPQSVTWNAYTMPEKTLVRLTFTPSEFFALYTQGALAHKAAKMEEGGLRKAAVEAAITKDEVDAA